MTVLDEAQIGASPTYKQKDRKTLHWEQWVRGGGDELSAAVKL